MTQTEAIAVTIPCKLERRDGRWALVMSDRGESVMREEHSCGEHLDFQKRAVMPHGRMKDAHFKGCCGVVEVPVFRTAEL